MLQNIRIVLVNTSEQRNIGSVARAMKTMGIQDLVLVAPLDPPQSAAQALAAGATDILMQARTVATLPEALAGCRLVMATSARNRTLDWPQLNPREAAEVAVKEGLQGANIALVFGREASGLTNEELQQSNYHIHIPANPDYSSLNLAMAVQTVTYEMRMAFLAEQAANATLPAAEAEEYPLHQELEGFYLHLEQVLNKSGFIVRQHPGLVMTKLRRLFTRARPEENELNILRGILASMEKYLPKA